MVNLHNILGTVVLLAFLVLTVLNIVQVTGRPMSLIRPVSILAAVLLLLQVLLGFSLLASGSPIPAIHYVIGLLAVVMVGLDHGWVRSRSAPELRAMAGALVSGAATILIVVAYTIGTSN